mmetsp:Transcript_34735/g.79656  ORF Transcript_34735/g.79656 Transcript_34735/m.79656 type:complete len:704 (-) Transcript_34735:60-2171(-)
MLGRVSLVLSILIGLSSADVNPVQKVLSLLADLEAKIKSEGAAEEKAYKEFVKWCDEASATAGFQIKTATAEKADLEAAVAKSQSDSEVSQASISDLAAQISSTESDLSNATSIREKEHEDFANSEGELVEAVDVLSRAISILEKEMRKNPAFLQTPNKMHSVQGLLATLNAVIDSAALSQQDKQKLVVLVQDHQQASDEDDELGAPAAATYKSHSSTLIDTLEDLREKAEGELADLRKGESASAHSFEMLKQSLTDQSAALNKELTDTKAALTGSQEALAQAKGDLEMAVKDLTVAKSAKATVDGDCKVAAEDHNESMTSRAAELDALAKAQDVISGKTGNAEAKVYSFLQSNSASAIAGRSQMRTRSDLAQVEIAAVIRNLAKKQQSTELAQLADRVSAVIRYGGKSGEDPFAKVKGLISDMIARLEKDASVEASHKAYCDEEQAKTAAQKAELTSDVDALSAKIDKAEAASAELKTEVAEIQKELLALTKLQGEMDKARVDEHAAFVDAKKDLELGLEGIQEGIRILRDYYAAGEEESLLQQPSMPAAHEMAAGSGKSIIGMLEVISSDFSKNLAAETVAEDEAQTQYERMTQENKITKMTKEQDVKYKTQEAAGLDKAVAEHSADRDGLQTELSAVLEYSEKLVSQCVAKPETYAERQARRTAEIEGLKEALTYLEGEAAFLQRRPSDGRQTLRSIVMH